MDHILDFFTRKSSLLVCLVGAVAAVILSAAIGIWINAHSRHPLELFPKQTSGIIKVDLAEAGVLFDEGYQFVDARNADSYNDGHIPGAYNLDFYDFDNRFASFQKDHGPTIPLVVYCQGVSGTRNEDTCETSKLLAERLKQMGRSNVLLFEQGWEFWEKSGKPAVHGTEQRNAVRRAPVPGLNYLRDLGMLLLGIAAIFYRKNRYAAVACQLILGVIFIISGSSKLFEPYKLSIIIDAYHIMPRGMVPFATLAMPWIELCSGICLLSGIIPASGALLVTGMNFFFTPALAYRALTLAHHLGTSVFAVNFDCGCGLGENFAWVLVLRDVGFFCMALVALLNLVRVRHPQPAPEKVV
jgi:rhodanese-related sulfurtransferase/uncharacterized membrane protein YphA (DoxX/SURF4 family)